MEAFMVKTGFYAVATRKEAERRAMAQWELEEQKPSLVQALIVSPPLLRAEVRKED
jgi:hypothetical protein